MNSTTFDYLLSPSLLSDHLPDMPEQEVISNLRSFLSLLQAEKAKNGGGGFVGVGLQPLQMQMMAAAINAAAAAAAATLPAPGIVEDVEALPMMMMMTPPPPAPLPPQLPLIVSSVVANSVPGTTNGTTTTLWRKHSVMQLMALQLACKLEWNITKLNMHIPISLQQQLIDCLVSACQIHKALADLTVDNADEMVREAMGSASEVFALGLFGRWVLRLRCASGLPLPLPPSTKIQIYSSLPGTALPAVGANDQGLMAQQWVALQAPSALRVLQLLVMLDKTTLRQPAAPEPHAFFLRDNIVVTDGATAKNGTAPGDKTDDDGWKRVAYEQWLSRLLFDMSQYHLSLEEYGQAAKCMKTITCLGCKYLDSDKDTAMLRGLARALSDDHTSDEGGDNPPPFQLTSPHDGELMRKVVASSPSKSVPYYWRVNYELVSTFHQLPQAPVIASTNIMPRIDASAPPNFEGIKHDKFEWPTDTSDDDNSKEKRQRKRKCMVLAALKDVTPAKEWSAKVTMSSRVSDGKPKMPKVRRRVMLSALFSETRPSRLQKMVHDLQKQQLQTPVRLVSSRWALDESIMLAYSGSLARGSTADNADLMTVSLCKIAQLFRLGQSEEALVLFRFVEGLENERTHAAAMKALQCHIFSCQLTRNLPTLSSRLTEEDMAKCRQCIIDLRNFNLEMYDSILENCLAALINSQDWDFIFSLHEQKWKLLQMSQIVLTIAIYFKGGNVTLDLKKASQHLLEVIQMSMGQQQQQGSGKRQRDAVDKSSSNSLSRFLSKISHPDYLQVLASFYCSLYNEQVEDSALRINHDFPTLPVAATAIASTPLQQQQQQSQPISGEQCLSMLRLFAERSLGRGVDAGWARLKGEVLFALGNHAAALKCFIQSLVLSSNFFLKQLSIGGPVGSTSGGEDKLVHKMIKCLSDLGFHSYAVGACQLLSDVDYSISFKNLEERRSNDGMDGVYANIWDVTVLEYAVSMHAKRGEHARRRSALAKIGSLEINTNNNIEILRETASYKRCSFLRVLCLHFL